MISLYGSKVTRFAWPQVCKDSWQGSTLGSNGRHAFRSSAYTHSSKQALLMASRASSKKTFHGHGPQTEPWKTMFCRIVSVKVDPFTTTRATRRRNDDLISVTKPSGTPLAARFCTRRGKHILSKAPETSAQNNATF